MAGLPLAGVRVLDLTHLWAGPLCTQVLARLGADVVKIEGPNRPDPLRLLPKPPYGQPSFDTLNAGKNGVAIDLGTSAGREALLGLLDAADGVVDNYSPRALENWGLDPQQLATSHRLHWISMPSFPTAGPLGRFGTHGAGIEGASGLAALNSDGGTPRLLDVPLTDPLAGLRAALAFLSSFRSGADGAHVELSQYEVARDVVALSELAPRVRLPAVPPIIELSRAAVA